MKIKVADLKPNPFRDFETYPIDRDRVESLKSSIELDTFWDNIVCRVHPTKKNKFQIAHGHHRLVAVKENGIKEVNLPVRLFTDAQMLRSMINENLEYEPRPRLIIADVQKAKNKLQEWIDQYKTWNEARSDKNILSVFSSEEKWAAPKGRGVGRRTIIAYLGDGWKKRSWMIQEALAALKRFDKPIKEGGLSRKAIEIIPTVDQASIFRKSVTSYKIPKPKQVELATKIAKEKIPTKRIPTVVRQAIPKEEKENPELIRLKKLIENIDKQALSLHNKIKALRREMNQLGIHQLKGIKVWLSCNSLKNLFKEMERLKERDSDEANS